MHTNALEEWQHEHVFGQDRPRRGERRTWIVIAITAVATAVEIGAGIAFGSMALLADGLHMASHAGALSITALAYLYVRRHAGDPCWAFGTGKVNSLAGFTGAILLVVFALIMMWKSVDRLVQPVSIAFNEAILVAVAGLLVNAISMKVLGVHHVEHQHENDAGHGNPLGHRDHNLRAAYLHVLADTLTSVLAIIALLTGKYFGLVWMDPLMGIVGSILVGRWSWNLLRATSMVLLDHQAPFTTREMVRRSIESQGADRVADLHVWSIGPGIYAGAISVVSHEPQSPAAYRRLLPCDLGIVHATIEVHDCRLASNGPRDSGTPCP